MPPAIAGTHAIARKLCTEMNGLSQCRFFTGRGYGGVCPQFNLAFSLEEAPTFGRSSLLRCGGTAPNFCMSWSRPTNPCRSGDRPSLCLSCGSRQSRGNKRPGRIPAAKLKRGPRTTPLVHLLSTPLVFSLQSSATGSSLERRRKVET